MTAGTSRRCQWCGSQFRIEFPTGTALYCKRSHKTSAEKWRKHLRANPPRPCPIPSVPAEPIRGIAAVAAHTLEGGRCWNCQCGNFHALDPETWLIARSAQAGSSPLRSGRDRRHY